MLCNPERQTQVFRSMNWLRKAPGLLVLFTVGPADAETARMERAEEPEEVGLVSVASAPLAAERETPLRAPDHGGFENRKIANGQGWTFSGGWRNEAAEDAPEGRRILLAPAGGKVRLSLEHLPVTGTEPHLLAMWLRTGEGSGGFEAGFTVRSDAARFGHHTPLAVPDTGGTWRRVGFFVRPVPGATSGIFQLTGNGKGELCLDDVRFGPVTEAAFARAWQGWRKQYPARDLSPRPEDGQHLGLFLEKALDAEATEPLLILGIGSSYTNMIGNGEAYIQRLRELGCVRPIHYLKHVGSAVEYDHTKGWMEQHVLERQPDLVILYSGGQAPDLDEMLGRFRARSTADVIVASLHLREQDREIRPDTVETPSWAAVREVCARHGVEFVENRREWADYLTAQRQPISWLLKDAVHQNDHGALVIAENIARHFAPQPDPVGSPDLRERRIAPDDPEVRLEGTWVRRDGVFVNEDGTGQVTVGFTGNRLDVSGDAGILGAEIDGMSAAQFPAFHRTLIVPGERNRRPERGMTADRAPHAVFLGPLDRIVPQDWRIEMRSDTGDYALVGSVTGEDGLGHNGTDFTGRSGQITVPTALWRRRTEPDGSYTNGTGDVFTFTVRRATTPTVDLGTGKGRPRSVSVVQNAENGPHEVTLRGSGRGELRISGFRVFNPSGTTVAVTP